MLTFNLDNQIKIEYDKQTNKIPFQINEIGPSPGIDIEEPTLFTPSDSNSIYISDTIGNDSTGDGSSALPYKTLLKGIQSCTVTKIYVIVLDSYFYDEDLSSMDNEFFSGVFADSGETPKYTTRVLDYTDTDGNTIYVSDTIGDDTTGTGTRADPVKTIIKGTTLMDGTHQNLIILDSATYTEPGFNFAGNIVNMRADKGATPTIKPAYTGENARLYELAAGQIANNGNIGYDTPRCARISADEFVVVWIDTSNFANAQIYYNDGTLKATVTPVNIGSSANQECIEVTGLATGNFVVMYTDVGTVLKANVYNNNGASQYSFTLAGDYFADSKNRIVASGLKGTTAESDGRFAVVSMTSGSPVFLLYTIYAEDGTQIKAQISTGISAGSLPGNIKGYGTFSLEAFDDGSDGVHCIAAGEFGTSNHKFIMYDKDGGVVVASTTIDGSSSSDNFVGMTYASNGYMYVTYYESAGNNDYIYAYDSAGVQQLAPTDIGDTGTFLSQDIFEVPSNNLCVFGKVGGVYKYIIVDFDGNVLLSPVTTTVFGQETFRDYTVLDNETIVFSLDESDPEFEVITEFYDYHNVSVGSINNGITYDCEGYNWIRRIFNCSSATLDLKYSRVQDQSLPEGVTFDLYIGIGDDDFIVSNSYFIDCEFGFGISAADGTFEDIIFARFDKDAVVIDSSGGATVDIQHCTFFLCRTGIDLDSVNGNEVVKNNILHDNSLYAIDADSAITYSYSVNTDSLNNVSAGSSVILANPLFVNEGAVTPDDIDLNIRTRILGFPTDSPALGLSDDTPTRNTGAYDVRYVGSSTTWSSITVAKPFLAPDLVPVKSQSNQRRDGSFSSSKVAASLQLTMKWGGASRDDTDNLEKVWMSDDSEVRIYLQPTSSPSTYEIYVLNYKKFTEGIQVPSQNDIGVDKVTMVFARGYERA